MLSGNDRIGKSRLPNRAPLTNPVYRFIPPLRGATSQQNINYNKVSIKTLTLLSPFLSVFVFLLKFLYPAGGIKIFLFAGKERMTFRTYLSSDTVFG